MRSIRWRTPLSSVQRPVKRRDACAGVRSDLSGGAILSPRGIRPTDLGG